MKGHVKNYHCKNTAGSYECSCRDGYEAVSDAKGKLQTCRGKTTTNYFETTLSVELSLHMVM